MGEPRNQVHTGDQGLGFAANEAPPGTHRNTRTPVVGFLAHFQNPSA